MIKHFELRGLEWGLYFEGAVPAKQAQGDHLSFPGYMFAWQVASNFHSFQAVLLHMFGEEIEQRASQWRPLAYL